MDTTVDVTIPLEPEAARCLDSVERRAAMGRYLSGVLKDGRLRDLLEEVIRDAKREAQAAGLTDEQVEAELAAWRSERRD